MRVLLLQPQQNHVSKRSLPPNHEDLLQDLELDMILDVIAKGDEFVRGVVRTNLLRGLRERDLVLYRQEVLKDCLRHSSIVREVFQTTLEFMEKKNRWWCLSSTRRSNPSLMLSSSLYVLDSALDSLKSLRRIADEHSPLFESQGFQHFFSMIQEELSDQYLSEVEDHLNTLKFEKGVLLSAQLGRGNQGESYQLCRSGLGNGSWLKRILPRKSPTYSFALHPRDEHGLKVVASLRNIGLSRVATAVSRAAQHVEGFFNALREELAFYLGCLNLHEELQRLGLSITFPLPQQENEPIFAAKGLYDLSLALKLGGKVVENQIDANEKSLAIITGPNRGGKTTFLRSVGQAQLMMECGMFVPADSFTANLSSGIFTHFKREEDRELKGGKLDEELRRMSDIVDHVMPGSLLLLNESFASTNDREGSEIANQIVGALVKKGVKVFYVTHLVEFARSFFQREMERVLFLRAERLPDGRRTFKLKEGKPMETSFGADLYEQVFH